MGSVEQPDVVKLLSRARTGDSQGRDRLFEICRTYLNLLARSQVETWMRAKVDASDIVQQTLLEAHRDFERFRGNSEAEWMAWLRQILSRNVTDFVRHYRGTAKRDARREIAMRQPGDGSSVRGAPEPTAPGATPSQEFARRDDELRIAAAITQLSPDHREVILLRNLQRLPFNDIAERMQRSRPAVQMLWMRAIRKLQEVLAAQQEDAPPGPQAEPAKSGEIRHPDTVGKETETERGA